MPSWVVERAAAAVAAALLAATGCGGGSSDSVARLRTEPILTAPPGGTELARASGKPQGGGLTGVEQPGYVEVVWAAPAAPEQIVAYYRDQHGDRYALYADAGAGPGTGQWVLSGLAPKAGDRHPAVRIVVRADRPHLVDTDSTRLPSPPAGTRSYVTVRITTG